MLISIVIPAHNRPELLLEAIASIRHQTYRHFEVIVVDDGSNPPISIKALEDELNGQIKLIRHDKALGVPKAKNAGIKAAQGEVITLLDDDDLLSQNALLTIYSAFKNHPQLDCLYLGVKPFGPYAEGPAKNRTAAISSIIKQLTPVKQDGLYFFSNNLFDALLTSVPIDFQRPAARKGAWNIVGGFDENSLFSESAWTIKASLACNIALTEKAITKWRIHGKNFGWNSDDLHEQMLRQMNNGINGGNFLFDSLTEKEKTYHLHAKKIRKYLSNQYFSKAYYLRDKDRKEGFKALSKAIYLYPEFKQLKLVITYIIPAQLLKVVSGIKEK